MPASLPSLATTTAGASFDLWMLMLRKIADRPRLSSTTAYLEALALAESHSVDETGLSATLRIVERTLRLQRTAMASSG